LPQSVEQNQWVLIKHVIHITRIVRVL
jgi:hypothetical protein